MEDNRGNKIDKFDSNKVIKPIEFKDDWRDNPLSLIDNNVNDEMNFAITKLTDGGRFVKQNHLVYKMRDIEIYTELNNIIFVDLHNNIVFIRDFVKVENTLNTREPESREYILLYTDLGFEENSEEDFKLRWEAAVGRTQAYEALKVNLPVIDIDKSLVLVDNVALKDAISVRQFIEHLQNANYVDPEEIDLSIYSGSEYI